MCVHIYFYDVVTKLYLAIVLFFLARLHILNVCDYHGEILSKYKPGHSKKKKKTSVVIG